MEVIDGYQKLCDTNKNAAKMGVITKGVCYSQMQVFENKKFKEPPN